MAFPELKQAQTLLSKSNRTLLIVPERASLDALSSMIALYVTLDTWRADGVDEVSPRHVPTSLQFLPGSSQVAMQPVSQAEVTLDIAGPTSVAAMRQSPLQGGVRIHVALPDGTAVTKDQLEVTVRRLPYDTVVVLGAADLEALGSIFTDHVDFFYHTPIINIDHAASNEYFGTVNIVDVTAGSVAEVVFELISSMSDINMTPEIATSLYAGIVAGTDSFQRPSTTPRSFQVAAQLLEHDADRDAVIQHLVKTKPLSLLKLTGRLYARLRFDQHQQLFWSIVRPLDFHESEASDDDLARALYELTNNIAAFNVVFVLREHEADQYELLLLLGRGLASRRDEIQAQLTAIRDNGLLHVKLTAPSLEAAEQEALERVRTILP